MDAALQKIEEAYKFLSSIEGYGKVPLVSLEKAIEPLVSIVPNIEEKAATAKQTSLTPPDGLSSDESASICLYSMEWKPYDQSLYIKLNVALREQTREKIEPWFFFLKLFITALTRLPSKPRTVYRGIKLDLHDEYPQGKIVVWSGFTSCTRTIDVLQAEKFLGKTGPRTMFIITCYSGKDICAHSYFSSENEIVLLTDTQFQVISCLDNGNDYHTIQLKEMQAISTLSPMSASDLRSRTPMDIQKLIEQISKLKLKADVYQFGKQLTEASVEIIVQQAIINKQCTNLYLKETNLTSQCAAILANALYNNITLTGLYLFENRISDVGVQSIAKALSSSNNRTLECLSLGWNFVTHEGAEYLAEMLKTNRTLKELWLSHNHIGDQGIQALTKSLTDHNRTLEILSVGWQKSITESTVDTIVDMLLKNPTLKKLDLVSCKLTRSDKTRLRDAIKSKKICELQT